MKIDEREVFSGLQTGVERARRLFETSVPDLDGEHGQILFQTLEPWPEDFHPRFQGLFAEMYAIAAGARMVNKEPRLTHDQVQSYFAHSADFFNSLKHR